MYMLPRKLKWAHWPLCHFLCDTDCSVCVATCLLLSKVCSDMSHITRHYTSGWGGRLVLLEIVFPALWLVWNLPYDIGCVLLPAQSFHKMPSLRWTSVMNFLLLFFVNRISILLHPDLCPLRLSSKAPLLSGFQLDLSTRKYWQDIEGGEERDRGVIFPRLSLTRSSIGHGCITLLKTTTSLNAPLMQPQVLLISPSICSLRSGEDNGFLLLLTPGYFNIPPWCPLTLFRPLEIIQSVNHL